jgi:hypothetical protein
MWHAGAPGLGQAGFAVELRRDAGAGAAVRGVRASLVGARRANFLEPVRTVISSCPPTAVTYCSRTSKVTLRERSIAAMRGWLTPSRWASSRWESPARSRSAVRPAARRSSSSMTATRSDAPGALRSFFSQFSMVTAVLVSSKWSPPLLAITVILSDGDHVLCFALVAPLIGAGQPRSTSPAVARPCRA